MAIAITEDGEKIISCVGCERWYPEEQMIRHRLKYTGDTVHMCQECHREEREKEREW
jgi:hypothetical protein